MHTTGIRIPDKKKLSRHRAIVSLPLPSHLLLPFAQHRGAPPPHPIVTAGQHVDAGELIAQPVDNGVGLHAPAAGTIYRVGELTLPDGTATPGVELATCVSDFFKRLEPITNWQSSEQALLLNRIRDCAVVGMGGAAFPTHIKLQPSTQHPIDTVIINGCECEPYLTADFRLMVEHAEQIVEGARIVQRISGGKRIIFALEKHYSEASKKLLSAFGKYPDITIRQFAARYPQGAEKVVIKNCTGRSVQPGGLPREVGVVVQNVATVFAIFNAVVNGQPLVERVITVSGESVPNPANLLVKIGTPASAAFAYCGYEIKKNSAIIAGGPMMGILTTGDAIGITKGTSGLLALAQPLRVAQPQSTGPCVRCGKCVNNCPRGHLPFLLGDLIEEQKYNEALNADLMDCMECGCCSFVCPQHRPIAHIVKQGKLEARKKPIS